MIPEKLRPCPFCGAHHPCVTNLRHGRFVECTVCGSRGPISTTDAMARQYWNRRKPHAATNHKR